MLFELRRWKCAQDFERDLRRHVKRENTEKGSLSSLGQMRVVGGSMVVTNERGKEKDGRRMQQDSALA